jgi:hypothetical protein
MEEGKWIHMIRGKDKWRGIVNTVIQYRLPYNVDIFLTSSASLGFSRTLFHGDCLLITIFGSICF